ncbi:hypothetical protein Pcac1_g27827 [Phytophthora cactorum]|nr:hypothetical protein Pcac1_g27827 [Phytophthora cactorum]
MSASASSRTGDLTSPTTVESRQASQRYKKRICKELLRSRLQQIELLEMNAHRLSKYSVKVMDAYDEVAIMLAHEKDAAVRLGSAAGVSAHDVGYVISNAVALEQCCSVLLEQTEHEDRANVFRGV